jgi:hypothetical protein
MRSPPAARPGMPRVNTASDFTPYVQSQQHLLQATEDNPLPTSVPPPIAANAGTLGVRHVISMIGLPERGKLFIARRLKAYLAFFHGAEVKVYDLLDYQRGEPGCDENADALLTDLRLFMSTKNAKAADNLNVANEKLVQESDPWRRARLDPISSSQRDDSASTHDHAQRRCCFKLGLTRARGLWADARLL